MSPYMQKTRRVNGPVDGHFPSTFQGFPPLSASGFSSTLPVYVGSRANIWGMDAVPKEKFKKKLEKEEPEPEPVMVAAPPVETKVQMLKDTKKVPRQRHMSVEKILSPDEALKIKNKVKKLAALSEGSAAPTKPSSPGLCAVMSSDGSDYDSDNMSRPKTSESRRHSPLRVLRPSSPTGDDVGSLGNLVTPLKAAPRRKAGVMLSKAKDASKDSKHIPKKVNLPRQMSHLFRSDAAAITEVASAEISEMSYLEVPNWHKYFGDQARISFQRDYGTAYRDLNKIIDGEINFTKAKSSPRSKYLREVALQRLPPLSLLMRKQEDPKGLDISHRGIGDKKMLPLVNVIEKLPLLQSVIVCDNRLTDISLTPLMMKLPALPQLMHLDLSYNKIDECSEYLMDYLRNEACRLQILILDGADVDDIECTHIAEALTMNTTLLSLSLKNNKIGTAESQNVATPNFVTGGEGLGCMLLKNKSILELDLSWNYIRLDSACAIAEALIVNDTLRVLRLAHNGFGDLGTQVMGVAIKQNQRLQVSAYLVFGIFGLFVHLSLLSRKVLDMAYNQVTPKAAAVLQNGLVHNDKLNTLVLDGNILGQIGARALVSAVQRASGEGRILRITFGELIFHNI